MTPESVGTLASTRTDACKARAIATNGRLTAAAGIWRHWADSLQVAIGNQ